MGIKLKILNNPTGGLSENLPHESNESYFLTKQVTNPAYGFFRLNETKLILMSIWNVNVYEVGSYVLHAIENQ